MNNKFLKIFIPIIIVLLIATLAFVITSNIFSNKNKTNIGNNLNNDNDKVQENTQKEEQTITQIEEKDVVVNSRIGTEILSKIEIPSIYSNNLIQILKSEGISNSYMLLYTYALINTNYDYHLLLKSLDDYSGNYILKSDFESVAKKYFGENISLQYNDIISKGDYDKENERYNIVATGYATNKLDYVIQIPYKIKQIDKDYFVSCYEVYATNNSGLDTEDMQSYNEIFYDTQRKNKIEKITDSNFEDPSKQVEYIKQKIENREINTDNLDNITYILQKDENTGSYIIKSIKNI